MMDTLVVVVYTNNIPAWFVTADLTIWDTAVQNVTDGLKVRVIYECLIFSITNDN